ncbi:hypothetical protein Q8A73_001040 [Channa argus]|nr:hypothetical protein Q8A73_001040 [Channa argus]
MADHEKRAFGSSDGVFWVRSHGFIEHEKRYLQCPEEGPDELRYLIYRFVFNKVIARSKAYTRLLLIIKAEYDDTIRELKRRKKEADTSLQTLAALTSHHSKLVKTCQRRAAQLRDSLCVLQRETAELQEEIKRQKLLKEQSTWIPGLTVAESKDPKALDKHMKYLVAQRAALLVRKSHCVSVELKAELDTKLQAAEHQRDQLSIENDRLKVLYKRLRFVCDHLSSWENEGQKVPLEELLGSTLENIRQTNMMDNNGSGIDAELFESEEPIGVDESMFLTDYLHRFIELFDSGQYEDAALLAARSPHGVLRNLDIMDMFKGVKGHLGSVPPTLLFSQALLITAAAGDKLSGPLSLQVVHCFLQHGTLQLVTHAINQNKLTFSEDLGDILTEHAQKNPSVTDMCLALATTIYEACRLYRKIALNMCMRGLIHSATEFMNHCKDFTAEDCMWVLHHLPSLPLLQLLTEPQQGRAANLSVGLVCSSLLAEPQHQELALQLLDSFVGQGRGVLEEVMLEDCSSSIDVWTNMASMCSELNRANLSQAIISVLLDQSGTRVLSPDLEGARLMEHVFL